MLKILFWLFVTVDVIALSVFGLFGLAAAGPSKTNPLAALVIPFFVPGALLVVAIYLFLRPPVPMARTLGVLITALPVLIVAASYANGLWALRSFRDAEGNIHQFRSQALRDIEAAIARNDAGAVTAAAGGADLNTPSLSGATALVFALRQLSDTPDQLDVLRALLQAGADPNVSQAELPLQVAIGASRTAGLEPVRLLLKAGANPNLQDEWGTPAFFSVGGAEIDVAVLELLLAHGADVGLKDKQGKSAVVTPSLTKNWRVLELLLRRGAPWRDQHGIQGVPFLMHIENEFRDARTARGADGLAEVLAILRSGSQ